MIKWLAICALSTAMIAIMMLLLVVLTNQSPNAISQNFLTVLYTTCLVGLFLTVVLIWKARYVMNTTYAGAHAHFQSATDSQCILDEGWMSILTQWNTHTSFGNVATHLLYMLYVFVSLLLIGVIFAIWALMKLAKNTDVGR